jgi:small subunit ribosomal protein S8
MTIDPISDMLVTIRNGIKARHVEVRMPASNLKSEIARVLKDSGYIENYITSSDFPKALVITLKYTDGAESAIRGLKRESKPGLRKFVGVSEIPAVLGGMGLAVLSTSKGVMSGKEAKAKKLGGELICTVW